MNISKLIFGVIPLIILLVVFVVVSLYLRCKSNLPESAGRGGAVSRISESLLVAIAGIVFLIYLGCVSNSGLILKLDEFRPEFARVHIVLFLCAIAGVVLSTVLAGLGRAGYGVVLLSIVLFSYSHIARQGSFGPGYLITKIAPKDSWEPIVNYTFEFKGKQKGVDLWINDVYLGKMPLTISGREFHKKVPLLDDVSQQKYMEEFSEKKNVSGIQTLIVRPEIRFNGGISYIPKYRLYFARVESDNKPLQLEGWGHCNDRLRSIYKHDYLVTIPASIEEASEMRKERSNKMAILIQKAMLSDYRVGAQWYETADTYGQGQFWKLRELSKREEGFVEILKTLEEYSSGEKKTPVRTKKLSLADLIFYGNIEEAVKIGGPDVEKYLLRQYQRDGRIEGVDIPDKNRKYIFGLHLNKAFYWLCHLDSDAGRKFRRRHRGKVMKFTELLTNNPFNHDRKPPEFLFFDLDEGKNSLAFQYWPKYFHGVEDSNPPWDYELLKKRWDYLGRLKGLATIEMYMDCWREIREINELMGGEHLVEAVRLIPAEKRFLVIGNIIESLEKRIAEKERTAESRNLRGSVYDETVYRNALKKYLAESGDEESLQWWGSLLKPAPNNHEPAQLERLLKSEKGINHPMVAVLAENKEPGLRKMAFAAIQTYPTGANKDILEKLSNDEDYSVQGAAQGVAEYLEEIANIPLEKLISQPLTKEVQG